MFWYGVAFSRHEFFSRRIDINDTAYILVKSFYFVKNPRNDPWVNEANIGGIFLFFEAIPKLFLNQGAMP